MSFPARAEQRHESHDSETGLLTRDDLHEVRSLVAEVAPGWSAELNQASAGESTIVVVPEGANDLIGPAFVLHRNNGRVQLDQFRWDEYRKLGGFRSLEDALSALRTRLSLLVFQRGSN